MSTTGSARDVNANAEAIEAWDGPLYDRFVRFRPILTDGLASHGGVTLQLLAPQPGQRVLDIGCGFGDSTQEIARLVGASGEAVGVDAASRFVDTARQETRAAGITNTRFMVADVQTTTFTEQYDLAFSRFGTMFFASPVAAFRNIRAALRPGGRLAMVVWRRRTDNAWLYRAQTIVEAIVSRPEEYDEPTCGPGPFSMADADTTTAILLQAGFRDISLLRLDVPIMIGRDLDEAVDFVTALGPAGEILRLAGDRAAHLHDRVRAALREGLAEYQTPDGLRAASSTWVVTAITPGDDAPAATRR
jgi:SAM-dependent methyltransferase